MRDTPLYRYFIFFNIVQRGEGGGDQIHVLKTCRIHKGLYYSNVQTEGGGGSKGFWTMLKNCKIGKVGASVTMMLEIIICALSSTSTFC